MVTGERRAKGQALLEALERPGISQLQVREFLELADQHGQARPAPSKQSDKPFFIPVPFVTVILLVQHVVVLLFLFCFLSHSPPRNFAEKLVLKLVASFSSHCLVYNIKS